MLHSSSFPQFCAWAALSFLLPHSGHPAPSVPAAAEQLELDAARATARLAGALRIATVSSAELASFNGATFLELHAYLEAQFPSVHRVLKRETVADHALLYSWQGTDSSLSPLLLAAHLDVVPADPATLSSWTHPPFGGIVADGFIWGRGALDDKSSALAQLEAVELLLAAGFQPRRTILFAYGHDEEVGGKRGAAVIAERLRQQGVRPAMVLDEGGYVSIGSIKGLNKPVALVGVAEKGSISVELSAVNPAGSSVMPPERSAVGILARAIERLDSDPLPPRLTAPVRSMYERLAPHLPPARRLMLKNLWLTRPILLRELAREIDSNALVRTTTAATMFFGSPRPALLPNRATAVVNFRALPGDSREMLLGHVRRTVDDERIQLAVLDSSRDPSPISPDDTVHFELLAATAREVLGDDLPVAPFLIFGATDARYYAAISPHVYRFQPQRLTLEDFGRMHNVDERLAVANYLEVIRFYHRFIRNADSGLVPD